MQACAFDAGLRIDKTKLRCNSCNKTGHSKKICITSLIRTNKNKVTTANALQSVCTPPETFSYGVNKLLPVVDLFEIVDNDKYLITVKLNGQLQLFEIDSGARYSLLPEDQFINLKLDDVIQPSSDAFRSYSGSISEPKEKAVVKVSFQEKQILGELHIVPSGHITWEAVDS